MKLFRFLAVTAALLAFFLAVLGSWVRINGAGMTCPDWPLCNGSLIPRFDGGVIYEWSHRLIALIEGFVLIGAVVSGFRIRREVRGVIPVLIALGIIFLFQVLLGGITVQLANRPDSVVYHWAAAMALLATLTTLATLAIRRPANTAQLTAYVVLLAATSAVALATMCAGAFVSSSGAGLACSGLPGCGSSFWGADVLQHAQMIHRFLAAIFTAFVLASAVVAIRRGGQSAWAVGVGTGLLVLQISLGFANVLYLLPIGLREAHAANAAATFLAFVIAAVLEALAAGAPKTSENVAYRDSLQSRKRLSSTPAAIEVPLPVHRFSGIISDFYELSKPRIIYLLLITTYASMMMAQRGFPPFFTTLWTYWAARLLRHPLGLLIA